MALKGERTDITYDADRRIVQLDAYVPELEPGEIAISVDLRRFSLSHPLRGGTAVTQELYDFDDEEQGYTIPQFSRAHDVLMFADGLDEPADIAESDDTLLINQHIGKLGLEAVAVAVATYDIDQAYLDISDVFEEPTLQEDLLSDYGNNVN